MIQIVVEMYVVGLVVSVGSCQLLRLHLLECPYVFQARGSPYMITHQIDPYAALKVCVPLEAASRGGTQQVLSFPSQLPSMNVIHG
jgi:hypothetical protein